MRSVSVTSLSLYQSRSICLSLSLARTHTLIQSHAHISHERYRYRTTLRVCVFLCIRFPTVITIIETWAWNSMTECACVCVWVCASVNITVPFKWICAFIHGRHTYFQSMHLTWLETYTKSNMLFVWFPYQHQIPFLFRWNRNKSSTFIATQINFS